MLVPRTRRPRPGKSSALLPFTRLARISTLQLSPNQGLSKVARPKAKPLNAATKKALKEKAEGTKFFYGELAAVYRKGQGAYLSSGSRNVPMAAWAMGRVNSYMRGDKARTADASIYARYNKKR